MECRCPAALTNYLSSLRYIAICDGRFDGRVCRPDAFQQCRTAIRDIAKDIETILQANADIEKMIEIAGMDNIIFQMTNLEKKPEKSVARLPEPLVETMQSFLDAYRGLELGFGKSASDCIAGQRSGAPTDSLYTQREIARVREILNQARLTQKIRAGALKKFLKLPYWRRRNDLYEVWILTKACSQFPHLRIQLCNVDLNGHWNIPGNGQGKITEPILRLLAPSGQYQVFTGLKLKEFQFPFEKSGRATGAMPDWLFCREIADRTAFDFSLFVNEGKRFEENGLIPEFIIECKAGASYGLLKTILDPMVRRYLPLLRTERGKALLVNYRQFNTP